LRIQTDPSPLSKWTPHSIPLLLSPAQEGPGEYDSTDKLYVSIKNPNADSSDTSGLCGTIYVYRRATDTTYEKTTYKIKGIKGKRFLEALSQVRSSVLLPFLFHLSLLLVSWFLHGRGCCLLLIACQRPCLWSCVRGSVKSRVCCSCGYWRRVTNSGCLAVPLFEKCVCQFFYSS
jgi:hypothetical protein